MIIIYSGGMDSTVLLYKYAPFIKLAISFDYGSKHNDREFEAAQYHTSKLEIKHIRVALPFINELFKSDLLKSGGDIPKGHYQDLSMKQTVVPFRNGIMLSIACGIAESIGAEKVLIANHSGDHTIYPDCRPTFIGAMNEAMAYGTYTNVNILSPFLNMSKREIALLGNHYKIDWSKTYSCYEGQDLHCGTCGTCVERKEALEGFDNTQYLI